MDFQWFWRQRQRDGVCRRSAKCLWEEKVVAGDPVLWKEKLCVDSAFEWSPECWWNDPIACILEIRVWLVGHQHPQSSYTASHQRFYHLDAVSWVHGSNSVNTCICLSRTLHLCCRTEELDVVEWTCSFQLFVFRNRCYFLQQLFQLSCDLHVWHNWHGCSCLHICFTRASPHELPRHDRLCLLTKSVWWPILPDVPARVHAVTSSVTCLMQ